LVKRYIDVETSMQKSSYKKLINEHSLYNHK